MHQKKVLVLLLVAITTTLAKHIRCPGNLSTDELVENLLDSTKFFKCTSEGRLQPLKCDDGLEFNAKLKICQHSLERKTVKWTNTICSQNGNIVANYTNDCLSFLLCDNGTVLELSCGSGYKFNTLLNHCDLEANVVCNCVGRQCPSFGRTLAYPSQFPSEQIITPCPCSTTTACPCATTTACPCTTTTACPCTTTTACPCSTTTRPNTTPTSTTSEYSTPGNSEEDLLCIYTTPPPVDEICIEGVPDERPVFPHTTPPPDANVCAEGDLDEPGFIYCSPGTRCWFDNRS